MILAATALEEIRAGTLVAAIAITGPAAALLHFIFHQEATMRSHNCERRSQGELPSSTNSASGLPTPLQVRDIGSFHVGGRMISLTGMAPRVRVSTAGGAVHPIDPDGEMIVGQMYVQYVKLAHPRSAHPLLLWHGGGMSGVNWETTPDGRPGWQMFFLRAGFDVFVSDAVERGRASWAPLSRRLRGRTLFPHGT